jgi:hypothetical protein
MLPVSAWPPGPPGASLSPFGAPRTITVGSCGCVLPKGAWVVDAGSNSVVMFRPDWRAAQYNQPRHQMGTGRLPGQQQWWQLSSPCPPPTPCCTRPTHDQYLEGWRAWQRTTGNTDPPIRPQPGRVPPNFAGWSFVNAPCSTLLQPGQSGTVLADGQNVVIVGGGTSTITQAFSV